MLKWQPHSHKCTNLWLFIDHVSSTGNYREKEFLIICPLVLSHLFIHTKMFSVSTRNFYFWSSSIFPGTLGFSSSTQPKHLDQACGTQTWSSFNPSPLTCLCSCYKILELVLDFIQALGSPGRLWFTCILEIPAAIQAAFTSKYFYKTSPSLVVFRHSFNQILKKITELNIENWILIYISQNWHHYSELCYGLVLGT